MSKQKITVKVECNDCGGTGLYTHNPSCKEGVALVCWECEGTGYREMEYTPFTKRKPAPARIKKIFRANPYSGPYYPEDHTFEDGKTVNFSQYGCTVEEWKNGVMPEPLPKD